MVLVSYGVWQRNLGGTRDFGSRPLRVSGHLVTIVGVMPPGFSYPAGADIWFPRELFPMSPYRTGHNWSGIGRVKNGVSLFSRLFSDHVVADPLALRMVPKRWLLRTFTQGAGVS